MSTNEHTPDPQPDRTWNTKKELIALHRAERDARRRADINAEREQHRRQKLKMAQRKAIRRDWGIVEKLDAQEAVEAAEKEWFEALLPLFHRNYGEIEGRLYRYNWIFPIDIRDHKAVEHALSGLIGRLVRYPGPLNNDEAFVVWAVNRATEPLKVTILQERFNAAVFSGVWPILKENPDMAEDRSLEETAQDIVMEAWLKFLELEKVDQITYSEGGSLVGFFQEIGHWQAMGQLTNHIREKKKARKIVPFNEAYDPDVVRSARKQSLSELESAELEVA